MTLMVVIPDRYLKCEVCGNQRDIIPNGIRHREREGLGWEAMLVCPVCGTTKLYRDPMLGRGETG